jgi:predicted lipid-binding transport protein (Tim44 family)
MLARLIFFLAAAIATAGSAALAGLLAAVIGLALRVPAATFVTMVAGAGATACGTVIALSSMAASLFFSPHRPPTPDDSTASPSSPRP